MKDDGRIAAAEARTALSEDRTVLANERTFAGWLRTGLASVAVGVGFHVLFQQMDPPWLPRAIATVFMLSGILAVIAAERRACAVLERLRTHVVVGAKIVNLRILAWTFVDAAAAVIVASWTVEIG